MRYRSRRGTRRYNTNRPVRSRRRSRGRRRTRPMNSRRVMVVGRRM